MDAAAVTHGTVRQYCSSETGNRFSQKQFCLSRANDFIKNKEQLGLAGITRSV
jgi:hypothetical protein